MNFTYSKSERLQSKILIDKLFNEGFKQYNFPIKLIWLIHQLPKNVPVQAVIAVSKKRFKRANKRNLLKRRIREAFRLNKNLLNNKIQSIDIQLAMIIIYNTNEIANYKIIESAIRDSFIKIIEKLNSIPKYNS